MSDSHSHQEAEEILLSRPEDAQFPNDASEFNNISVKFLQSHRAHLENKKFCIYDNKFLQISSFKNNIQQQYWINLAYVDAKVDRKFIMNKLWLWLSLFFLCVAASIFFTNFLESILILSPYKNPIVILNMTLAFMSLVTLLGKARSVVYLRSSNGAVPMVEILHNIPNKAAYHHFLDQLAESVQIAKTNNDIDISQQLAAELKDHRRLRDQGILSQENYAQAKESIFSLHSHSTVTEKMLPH